MTYAVDSQSYGKSHVRLTHVSRDGDTHSAIELSADIRLQGDFDAAYTDADNSLVIPTDTMKNTVYVLAKRHGVRDLESFGIMLAGHFVDRFDHVDQATVSLIGRPWQRIHADGSDHAHAFIGTSQERETCTVVRKRDTCEITSGLADLLVLKTTHSGFSGFLKDDLTTLPELDDRLFATTIAADWKYDVTAADWTAHRREIREKLLQTFADHHSLSVQHTLHAMATAALDACDAIASITLNMPNQHRLLVDLQPFGLENVNEVFVPTAEPFGVISATVKRN